MACIHQKNIEQAVVVVIEQGHTAGHGLNQVLPRRWRIAQDEIDTADRRELELMERELRVVQRQGEPPARVEYRVCEQRFALRLRLRRRPHFRTGPRLHFINARNMSERGVDYRVVVYEIILWMVRDRFACCFCERR